MLRIYCCGTQNEILLLNFQHQYPYSDQKWFFLFEGDDQKCRAILNIFNKINKSDKEGFCHEKQGKLESNSKQKREKRLRKA